MVFSSPKKNKFYSIIDIDVFQHLSKKLSFEDTLSVTKKLHDILKEVFFNDLLTESFINTLNPNY